MDVVDLVSLIDRFDSPASVLPYLEHPDPRVRLAVAQWFGPGLEGTDAWIRRKSVDLYPRMGAVEGRPDMPVGLFTALVADPDPQVRMAALHRCWDVGLLVGLVDPRALLAGTAAETAGDPVARLVRVHLLLLREAGDHEVSAAAALALDPSLAPASGTGAPTAGPGPRHLVLEPRAQARGPLEVASWQDWADRCARFGIPELPVCRGQIVFTMLSVPLGEEFWDNVLFSSLPNKKYEHVGADPNHPGGWPVQTAIAAGDFAFEAGPVPAKIAAIMTFKAGKGYQVFCAGKSQAYEALKPELAAIFNSFKILN